MTERELWNHFVNQCLGAAGPLCVTSWFSRTLYATLSNSTRMKFNRLSDTELFDTPQWELLNERTWNLLCSVNREYATIQAAYI